MAHQTSNIPWNILASNLQFSKPNHIHSGNLHLRHKPGQGKQLHYFVEALTSNIRQHAAQTRKRYPKQYDAPHPDDIILDDATVRKITPTVHRLRSHRSWTCDYKPSIFPSRGEICQHKAGTECQCPIPYEERRASSFYRRYHLNACYRFPQDNGKAFLNLEIVKTLLLHGEMDVIFRVCAYPSVDLGTWWDMFTCYCNPHDVGWDSLCRVALLPYIGLNIIFCFPETWDPASGMTDEKDYRQMKIYQYIVHQCTMSGMTSEVATHPHRQFFGIEDGQFNRWSGVLRRNSTMRSPSYLYGSVSFTHFLNSEAPYGTQGYLYGPGQFDVTQVQVLLYSKGLPMELVLEIMDLAEYAPKGRLRVPHHPFHRDNWDELEKYLKFCWKVLVRCDMMASALGMVIPWQDLVSQTLTELLDCCTGPWWTRDRESTPNSYTFL